MDHRTTSQEESPNGHQKPESAAPLIVTEIVYSPDDGGFWISQNDLDAIRSRASVKVFPTKAAADRALKGNKVKWEKWS